MSDLSAHGVRVGVPSGWEAELGVIDEDPEALAHRALTSAGATPARVLLHVANFALPADRGDYGSGAVELMDGGSVLIVVMEFDAESARTALFASEGVPRDLHPDDFSTVGLQRALPGQCGTQRFFHIGDRAFCLYVVLGSNAARTVLTAEANRLLAGLAIA